mmetsp:Transcript_98497/g.279111  ORF Transcript_98497/g.279111 Transcript_98497/m.279111 type:complete len:225 (+) Transcript_98497:773-1447(+)
MLPAPAPLTAPRLFCTTPRSSQASCTSKSTALNSRGHLACSCLQATTPPRMSCCRTFRASGWQTRSRNDSSAKRAKAFGAHGADAKASARTAMSSRKDSASMAVVMRRAMLLAIMPSTCRPSVAVPAGLAAVHRPASSGVRWPRHCSTTLDSRASWPCTWARCRFDQAQRHCAPWTEGGGSGGGGHHPSRLLFWRPLPLPSAPRVGQVTSMTCASHRGRRMRLR